MTSGGMRSGATARSTSSWAVGSRTGQPGSPCQAGRRSDRGIGAVGLDERRDRLRPDPGHPRRPEQDRGRVRGPRTGPDPRRGPSGRRARARPVPGPRGRPRCRRAPWPRSRPGPARRRRPAARRRTTRCRRGAGRAAGPACRRGRPSAVADRITAATVIGRDASRERGTAGGGAGVATRQSGPDAAASKRGDVRHCAAP